MCVLYDTLPTYASNSSLELLQYTYLQHAQYSIERYASSTSKCMHTAAYACSSLERIYTGIVYTYLVPYDSWSFHKGLVQQFKEPCVCLL
jgi:hypothetical protein